MRKGKKIVGRIEKISIPELELFDLDAKVDTGADSSALHCEDIVIDKEKNTVSFTLFDKVHPAYHNKRVTFPLYKVKKVRSSDGQMQYRPSIKAKVEFFGKKYTSIITLTNRIEMKFPMIIGRRFLSKKFLVDVSQKYLSAQRIKKGENNVGICVVKK